MGFVGRHGGCMITLILLAKLGWAALGKNSCWRATALVKESCGTRVFLAAAAQVSTERVAARQQALRAPSLADASNTGP